MNEPSPINFNNPSSFAKSLREIFSILSNFTKRLQHPIYRIREDDWRLLLKTALVLFHSLCESIIRGGNVQSVYVLEARRFRRIGFSLWRDAQNSSTNDDFAWSTAPLYRINDLELAKEVVKSFPHLSLSDVYAAPTEEITRYLEKAPWRWEKEGRNYEPNSEWSDAPLPIYSV